MDKKLPHSHMQGFNLAKLTAVAFRAMYLLSGYPRYTKDFFYSKIYSPMLPSQEIGYIRRLTTTLEPFQVVYCTMILMFLAKNSVYPIYTVLSMNLLEYEFIARYNLLRMDTNQTTGPVSAPTQLGPSRYGCLATNCTKLSPNNPLRSDLKTLPVFKLCFPMLRELYYPVLDTHFFGLTMHTVIMHCIIMMSIGIPVASYLRPSSHDVGVFVIAPKSIHRLHAEVIRQFLIERLVSLKCYYANWKKAEEEQRSVELFDKKAHGLSILYERPVVEEVQFLNYEQAQLEQLREDYSLISDQRTKDYIDDCVPLIRCEFYAALMAKQFWSLVRALTLYVLILSVACVFIPGYISEKHVRELRKMDQFIESTGCSVWLQESDSILLGHTSQTPIRVSEPAIEWNWFVYTDAVVQLVPTGVIICLGVPISIMLLQEINIVIAEQIDRLQLAIELTELLNEMPIENGSTTGSNPVCCHQLRDSSFKELRSLHRKHLRTDFGFIRLQPFKHQTVMQSKTSSIRMREFAAYLLIEYGTSLDNYLDILIKAYIGNRALIRMIHETSRNLSVTLLFSYITSYGFVLIVVYFSRKFDKSDYTSVLYGLAALLLTNIVISIAARVQANSKHLVKQVWILIALTNRYKDPRIKHMRALWLKQVVVLSQGGAITLKAFNIPVTYETVIEMMLWSSSLTLLAFNR